MFEPLGLLILLLALGGPATVAFYGTRGTRNDICLPRNLACQFMLMTLSGVALWVMIEPLAFPASSLGLDMPDWRTLALGAGIAAFFVFGLGPVLMRLPGWLGLSGFERTLRTLSQLPIWYLVLAVVVGGIAEEILYRGVAFTILSSAGFGPWSAGLLVVLAFALAHIPLWGVGPALTNAISGACLTLFFIWHGDLIANIIGHVVTDFVGIVLGPLLSRKDKEPIA